MMYLIIISMRYHYIRARSNSNSNEIICKSFLAVDSTDITVTDQLLSIYVCCVYQVYYVKLRIINRAFQGSISKDFSW